VENNIPHSRFDNEDQLLDRVVDQLTGGKVVAVPGAVEWGAGFR